MVVRKLLCRNFPEHFENFCGCGYMSRIGPCPRQQKGLVLLCSQFPAAQGHCEVIAAFAKRHRRNLEA